MVLRAFVRLAPLLAIACGFDSGGVASDGVSGSLGSGGSGSSDGGGDPTSASASASASATTDGSASASASAEGPSTTTAMADDGSSGTPPTDDSGSSSTDPNDPTTTGEPEEPTCNGVPLPSLPNALGPVSEVSVQNVRFPSEGTNIARVAPAAYVDLEFDYDIASCGCEDCITQGLMGIVDAPWRDCFYGGVPACNTDSGTAQMQVQAPDQPGLYLISFWRTWEYDCNLGAGGPNPDDAVAAICVHSR
jgi:hypothetical protein